MRISPFRSIKTPKNSASHLIRRGYGSEAVLRAAVGIGQSFALLMKLNSLVSNLAFYDIANIPGVSAYVRHTSTRSKIQILSLDPLLPFGESIAGESSGKLGSTAAEKGKGPLEFAD
ncbi:hypothetical protein GH714_036615 [Hevea brasiliensis]|uniref:Uncharacterized protein n=1 Tax=Hevea brasiliensis TaxID=3981 RepID=A0A6A6LPS7_HEVBR|nr:hypothetical protein GH714_036615 [Hevea brasiliensis]